MWNGKGYKNIILIYRILEAKMVGKALVEILKPDNTWNKIYYAVDKGALCYTHTKKGTSLSSIVIPIL